MKKYKAVILSCILILLTVSCATTVKVTSNKDASYNKNISRIIIYCKLHSEIESFTKYLYESLSEEFKKNNVECLSYIEDDLSLETDVQKNIADFKPDVLLAVLLKKGVSGMNTVDLTIEAQIADVTNKNVIWKAEIDFKSHRFPNKEDSSQLAVELINKMKQDKLF